ncbi:BRO1-like domain-containing protein [Spinellus fusiger]|nr:BRO1-like domain-containing protein [Spinellus fusiger]
MPTGMLPNAAELPSFLAIPTRQTDSLTWAPSLFIYIESAYGEDGSFYAADAQCLDSLRASMLDTPDIESMFIYYSQLTFMCSRFPLDINLGFPWHPVFQPNDPPVVHNNIYFEKACVLFSIGALYSQQGSAEQRQSSDSIRKACNYFQQAAGCFKYIQREIVPEMRYVPQCDVSPGMLDVWIVLMLAQAQECVWQKATMEHLKPGTIARLAIKVVDFYETLLEDTSPTLPMDWQTYIRIKASYYEAVTQYHKANECISQAKYGEEIARLRLAEKSNRCALNLMVSNFQWGQKGAFHTEFVNEIRQLEEAIERDLIRAEKDNDLVYLERVPSKDHLSPILRSDMVRPVIPSSLLEPVYQKKEVQGPIPPPVFQKLVPFAVHQAASIYKDKRLKVEHEIIKACEKMRSATEKLLEELCLPDTLDVLDVETLPPRIITNAEEIQEQGGIQALKDMLAIIQDLSKKNAGFVDEGFNALEEENEQNEILQRQYGTLWARPPSKLLTSSLLSQGSKYYDTLQAAQKADRIVRAKVTNWGKAIELLSQPVADIKANLPLTAQESFYPDIKSFINTLRRSLEDLSLVTEEQMQLVKEVQLIASSDDISHALLAKADQLTGGSPMIKMEPEQFGDVFEIELKKYTACTTRLQDSTVDHQQKTLILKTTYEHFTALTQNKPLVVKREKTMKNLEQAYVKFKEIRTNLVEGIKFYSHYTDTLGQFKDNCIDYALARRMEASELARSGAF